MVIINMTGLAWNLTGIIIMADGKLELDEFMGISISTLELTVRSSPSFYCDHGNCTFLAWDIVTICCFSWIWRILHEWKYILGRIQLGFWLCFFLQSFPRLENFVWDLTTRIIIIIIIYLSRLKLTSSSDLEETFRKTDFFWVSRIGEYRFGFALEAG